MSSYSNGVSKICLLSSILDKPKLALFSRSNVFICLQLSPYINSELLCTKFFSKIAPNS